MRHRGGGGRPGALPAGHNRLGVPHPPAGARLRGQALSGGRPLRARRAGGGTALQREDHLPPGCGPLPVPGAVWPQPPGGGGGRAGRAGRLRFGPQRRRAPGLHQGRRAGRGHPHPLPGGGRPRRALPGGLGGRPGGGSGGGGAAGLCPRGGGAPFPAPPVPGLGGIRGLWHGGVPCRAGRAGGGGSLGARGLGRGCGPP